MTHPDDMDFPCSQTYRYLHDAPYPMQSGRDRTPLEGRMLADLLDGLVEQVRALRQEQAGQREQVRQLTEWKNQMVKRMAERQAKPIAKPPIKEEKAAPTPVKPETERPHDTRSGIW